MLTSKKLARALSEIASQSNSTETTANSILEIVKTAARTPAAFDEAVRDAYRENGWQAGRGRPRKGQDAAPTVPRTVKTYVSEVRRALRLKVQIGRVSTFGELRAAIKAAAAKTRKRRPRGPVELTGVKLARPEALIGQPFHDLSALYAALPADSKLTLVRQVDRLVTHYKKALPDMPVKQLANAA